MDPSKLTEKAQEALGAAQHLAEERHNTQLEPDHLLYVLVTQQGGVVPALLGRLGIQPRTILDRLEPALEGLAQAQGTTKVYVSPRFRKLIEADGTGAKQLKDDYVSTEHCLLALAGDRGPVGQVLRDAGVTRDQVLAALQQVRGSRRLSNQAALHDWSLTRCATVE